jgi:hypothetical protein
MATFRSSERRIRGGARAQETGEKREKGGGGVGDEREKVMGTEREDKYFRKFSLSYYTHMEV